jgi:hypothetical protein
MQPSRILSILISIFIGSLHKGNFLKQIVHAGMRFGTSAGLNSPAAGCKLDLASFGSQQKTDRSTFTSNTESLSAPYFL